MMHIKIRRTHLPRYFIALAAILALLSAWNIARIAMLFSSEGRVPSHPTRPIAVPSARPRVSSAIRILRSGLFGNNTSTPRIPLHFTLEGTYAGAHGQGFAIIADSHHQSDVYAEGSYLPGHIRIASIDAHRVMLDTPYGEESLSLHEPDSSPSFRVSSSGSPSPLQAKPGSPMTSSIQGVTRLPSTLLHILNLRPGDTVVTLNGQRVMDEANILHQLKSIPPNTPVHIRVLRDGRPITLKIRAPALSTLDRTKP